MKVVYTERARKDLEIAFAWYEKQNPGLGLEFLDSVEFTIKSIEHRPHLYAINHSQFRRALLRRFPFAIFYTLEQHSIVIHAVFDCRQDPEKMP